MPSKKYHRDTLIELIETYRTLHLSLVQDVFLGTGFRHAEEREVVFMDLEDCKLYRFGYNKQGGMTFLEGDLEGNVGCTEVKPIQVSKTEYVPVED